MYIYIYWTCIYSLTVNYPFTLYRPNSCVAMFRTKVTMTL